MKEVIFRGKDLNSGVWVYGNFYCDKEQTDNGAPEHYYREYDIQVPYIYDGKKHYLIDINTIGQFIGRKDKNSLKIFDGDIIGENEIFNANYKVIYNENSCKFSGEKINDRDCNTLDFPQLSDCGEVIGNIYENPELLK